MSEMQEYQLGRCGLSLFQMDYISQWGPFQFTIAHIQPIFWNNDSLDINYCFHLNVNYLGTPQDLFMFSNKNWPSSTQGIV